MSDETEMLTPAVMSKAVPILNEFAKGCVDTQVSGKKPWTCPTCYEAVIHVLLRVGVPNRRLAEVMVMAHRYE
jgi:hypothetical protein